MENSDEGTSTAPSNGREDPERERCEYCGEPIDTSDWYLVSKQRDSDGTLQFYSFCSEECQDGWHDEQPDDD